MTSLLALASSAVWGTSDFIAGVVSRRIAALAVVGWSQGIGALALTVLVLLRLEDLTWSGWPLWAVVASGAGVTGLVSFYSALSSGSMGVVAPIATLGVLVPVLAGLALGERPGLVTWLGMVLAIVGVVLASGPEITGAVSTRPLVLAVVAAVGFGVTLLAIDRGSRSSVLLTLWGMRTVSAVGFAVVLLVVGASGGARLRDAPVLTVIGLGDLGANALFGLASSMGRVSVVSVLGSLYAIVTMTLARVILGERLRWVQRLGSLLAVAGAAVIVA